MTRPLDWTEPNVQDDVKNLNNEYAGRVVAKYQIGGKTYFDVRVDDQIYYKTLAENWVTTTTEEERDD